MAVIAPSFTGFRPEAIQFLADLTANNERAWFQPRKAEYERLLKEPMEELCVALEAEFRGLPFEPCFNLEKTGARSFRGSVSGLSFAYCDFHRPGSVRMTMAREPERRKLEHHRTEQTTGSIEAPRPKVVTRVETPPVESASLKPVKSPVKPPELRPSTE